MRARLIVAEAADLVLFIGFEIAFEPFDMAVALEREDVRREAIEEEAVMADDHRAAREILQRLFECGERFGVEIVGRFVEQQHVAALFQHLGHMDAVALAARQLADLFLLVDALEVEGADISARLHLVLADVHHFSATRSEEHTSELQSLMRISYAVFCLKKKNNLCHSLLPSEQQHTTRLLPRHSKPDIYPDTSTDTTS